MLLSLITSFMHLSVHRFIYCVNLISILSWLPILTIHYEQVHRNKVGHRHTHLLVCLIFVYMSYSMWLNTTYLFRYLCLLFHLRKIITLYYNNALGKKERRRKKKEEIIKSCKVSFASKMIVMSSLPLTRSLCYQEEISWEIERSKDNTLIIHKSLNRKQAYFLWCAFTGKFRLFPLLFSASWKQSSH